MFVSLCGVEAPEDGLTFQPESVQVEAIHEDHEYGGMRVKLMAMLGNVRIPLQVDVGAGDAVVPPPEILDFPGLIDLPRAHLRAYRHETSIAEKTEAMVRLALANSRMKDFFDIHRLADTRTFDGETIRLAVAATFARRDIDIPSERPLALTLESVIGSDCAGPRSRAIMLALVAFEGLTPPQLDATAEETMSPIARRPMPSSLLAAA